MIRFSDNASRDAESFLAETGNGRTTREYRKGQTILSQGDAAEAVFFIRTGRVKIIALSEQGKEAIVSVLGPGQFFGERCFIDIPVHVTTAEAMEDCQLTRIEKSAMLDAVRTIPDVCETFVSRLLARMMQLEEDLTAQLFDSSEKRLARILLRLAEFGRESPPQPVIEKFSQEELAEMVGTTRSRVSHFMNKFRKLGYIEYNGMLVVHNTLLNVLLEDGSGPNLNRDDE